MLAASITVLYWQTLPLYIVPALAAALFARFTSFGIACGVGLLLGMAQSVLLYYLAPKPWFPTDHGIALPGVWDLFVFLVIVVAMFWRGASLPGRGELIEKRLPFVPRSEHLARNAVIGTLVCGAALVFLPWDFRQALIVSLLASLICLSYVIITGFVGQISVVQLALAGVAGFTVSHMAVDFGIEFPLAPADRLGGGDGAGAARGSFGTPCARRQPGRRHAGRGGRDREVRVRQLQVGRRFGRLARAATEDRRLEPRPGLVLARPRRQAARARCSASSCSR